MENIKKHKGKTMRAGVLILLAFIIAMAYYPVTVSAADTGITCDISKGSVTVDGGSMTYTDTSGTLHTDEAITSSTAITVTGTTTENTIKVIDYWTAPIKMTFKDLSIDVSQISDGNGGYVSACAAYFGGDDSGKVKLTLEGTNTLKSLDYAGLAIPAGETVTIDGSGTLNASTKTGNASVSGPAIGAPVSNNNPPAYIISEKADTSFGKIIINGGTINAESDDAGIGGGQGCSGGDIVINGGTVNATAGKYSSSGIGCGQDSSMGSILIRGGVINATGSNAGAGIGGGGMHTNSGIITILGGTVTATGGNYGAGIGGDNCNGAQGDADLIHIGGGTIKAYGGKGAAGIGGGAPYGISDDITITGGTVYAYGGGGDMTEGNAYGMIDGKRGIVGTRTTVYGAGAGIGNGGGCFAHTNYTAGTKAGTSETTGSTRYGGKITIKGGTVYAFKGTMTAEQLAAMKTLGVSYVDAEGLGNGSYSDAADFQKDYPYEAVTKSYTGGMIYSDNKLVYPSKPGKAVLKLKSAKKSCMTASWKAVTGAKTYQIRYKKSGGKWKTTSTAKTAKTFTKLTKGKKYKVQVRAKNAAGYGSWSAAKTVKIKKK